MSGGLRRLGFVVDSEALDDGAALGVEADEFDLGAELTEFEDDLVERVNEQRARSEELGAGDRREAGLPDVEI